jgi:hypothetical protein
VEQWLREDVFLLSSRDPELQHLYRAMDFLEEQGRGREGGLLQVPTDERRRRLIFTTPRRHLRSMTRTSTQTKDAAPTRTASAATRNGRTDARRSSSACGDRDGCRCVLVPATPPTSPPSRRSRRICAAGVRPLRLRQRRRHDSRRTGKLALGGGKYILGAKMRAGDEVTKEVLARQGRYHQVRDNLRVKEVIVGDGERRRRYVVCHNPDEATRQQEHRRKLVAHVEAEIATMKADSGKHSKRICELLTSSRYGRYCARPRRQLRIDRAAVAGPRYDGQVVITQRRHSPSRSGTRLSSSCASSSAGASLASGLRMRQSSQRPADPGPVTISVLALLLERVAEIRANDTWRNIAAQLDTIKVVEYDRGEARIHQTSELRTPITELLVKLGVPLPPRLHTIEQIPSTRPHRPSATTGELENVPDQFRSSKPAAGEIIRRLSLRR